MAAIIRAHLLRRALRVSFLLAIATTAGFAAGAWAGSERLKLAGDLTPVAAPRVVGAEARSGRAVALGSRIVSGPGSGLKFTLDDNTRVIIGPNSTISVDEFAADRVVLRLERGSFHLDSANPGTVYVILPSGSIAVRAATVAGRIGPDRGDWLRRAGRAPREDGRSNPYRGVGQSQPAGGAVAATAPGFHRSHGPACPAELSIRVAAWRGESGLRQAVAPVWPHCRRISG
jgi:hypothetical protein